MSVYKAINAVQAELAKVGIGKTERNQQQGFMFRGIDAVYTALAPLLAKHGLLILPTVVGRTETVRQTRNGGLLYSVVVDVQYRMVAAEDGSTHECRIQAEAMDSADKATNKAMSAAYKYLCLQTFCIPTEGESPDADAESHEETRPKGHQEPTHIDADKLYGQLEHAAHMSMGMLKAAWEGLSVDEKKAVGGAKALAELKSQAPKEEA